jgi:hypothetical protein
MGVSPAIGVSSPGCLVSAGPVGGVTSAPRQAPNKKAQHSARTKMRIGLEDIENDYTRVRMLKGFAITCANPILNQNGVQRVAAPH